MTRHTLASILAARARVLACALLLGIGIGAAIAPPSAWAHHFAPNWERGGATGPGSLNLRYNLNLTQYGDPVTEGLVRWNNAGTAAHFTWTPYNESVMDVYDDTGLGQGTLGRTTIVSTAGTDQTCTQGAITYVRIGLNPTTLGSGPTNDYWEIVSVSMHEFGHGMGLAHSNTGNVCGINGMYPYQSDSQSLMASGYNLSTRLPAPEVKQHDRQDMYDIYP